MRILPFAALRPQPAEAALVAAPPYDVVSRSEAQALAAHNPLSLLHVSRAEIDLPELPDPFHPAVYSRAASQFEWLIREGHLVRQTRAGFHLYRQSQDGHSQDGLVALCRVEDYDRGIIKKHELTRPDKENDRTKLTAVTRSNLGPVFLAYRDHEEIQALSNAVTQGAPDFDFTDENGVRHTAWPIPGGQAWVEAFAKVPCSYIADGHHRAASAARVGRELAAVNVLHNGREAYNYFLTVLFPASHLRILGYHRLVKLEGAAALQTFLTGLARIAGLTPVDDGRPDAPGEFRLFAEGIWRRFHLAAPAPASPVDRLDVSLLQDRVLRPLLGLTDPRTDPRLDFVGGRRGPQALSEAVLNGRASLAIALHPTSLDQLMEIADAGQIMPPKSTWFEPKLRSGLFIHTF